MRAQGTTNREALVVAFNFRGLYYNVSDIRAWMRDYAPLCYVGVIGCYLTNIMLITNIQIE